MPEFNLYEYGLKDSERLGFRNVAISLTYSPKAVVLLAPDTLFVLARNKAEAFPDK